MLTPEELQSEKDRLLKLAVQDLEATIQSFKSLVPKDTDAYVDVVNIEGQLNEHKRKKIQQVLSAEDEQLGDNQIRSNLIALITGLEMEDLSPSGKRRIGESTNRKYILGGLAVALLIALIAIWALSRGDGIKWFVMPPNKTGQLLYKIPAEMELREETECLVRISFDSISIQQGINMAEATMETIRTSQKMSVELINSTSKEAFKIRNVLGDEEQFIEKGDYTEWRFGVTPLLAGTHDLILKVMIIEEKDGKERRKNLSFDRSIQIKSTAPDMADFGFEQIGRIVSLKAQGTLNEEPQRFSKIIEADGDGVPDLEDITPPDRQEVPVGVVKPPPPKTDDFGELEEIEVISAESQVEEMQERMVIFFRYNSTKYLNPERIDPYLDRLAQRLQNTGERLEILGHTDGSGEVTYNRNLGLKRANKIKRLLTQRGVNADQITIVSKGESQPIASNEVEEGRRNNRRVELRIIR